MDQTCGYSFSASRPQEKVKIIKNVSGLLKTYFPNTFPLNKILNICSRDIVAVVDPPRAGLHAKALSAIRNTLSIRQVQLRYQGTVMHVLSFLAQSWTDQLSVLGIRND